MPCSFTPHGGLAHWCDLQLPPGLSWDPSLDQSSGTTTPRYSSLLLGQHRRTKQPTTLQDDPIPQGCAVWMNYIPIVPPNQDFYDTKPPALFRRPAFVTCIAGLGVGCGLPFWSHVLSGPAPGETRICRVLYSAIAPDTIGNGKQSRIADHLN
ncbi:hypothetical protein EJ08DRAFT_97421 [Tothia fuscella]|uniref:Uncharacterized protein n=1 Tax=Tothia fuscella TaxID=1048955 RepID=A0A9P4NEH6_9PEZI|nr:hypothetical protein EJ08DRAFT_97421 [Tothia fuscella]